MIESSDIMGCEVLHHESSSAEDLNTFSGRHIFSYRRLTRDRPMDGSRDIEPLG